ncbi:MAG: Hsp20/alpha crystallin family protein [Acidobacteriota bacterium]
MAHKQERSASRKAGAREVPVKQGPPLARFHGHRHHWHVPAWEREVDRWFEDFRRHIAFPRWWGREAWWPPAQLGLEMPVLDMYEKGDDVVVKAEIPGMSKDDIEVNLADHTLTVKGEKKKEEEVDEEGYYCCERSFGSFSRTVELPADVKTEEATATFKDGVLEVRLPKTEAAKRKAVKVQVR